MLEFDTFIFLVQLFSLQIFLYLFTDNLIVQIIFRMPLLGLAIANVVVVYREEHKFTMSVFLCSGAATMFFIVMLKSIYAYL